MPKPPADTAPDIVERIFSVRGQRVLLDADLASMYEVSTKRLNEQVRRNEARFPGDFTFVLSDQEVAILRSQFATSSWSDRAHGGRRYAPRVFTEHGAIMAATILNTPRAVQVSVYVVRAFVKLRELLASNTVLARRLETEDHLSASILSSAATTPGLRGTSIAPYRQTFMTELS